MKPEYDHRGVSLVELLIAMSLGLILLGGMIAVFSGNKRSSELNTAMANMQENARFALSALGQGIRMSGYQGCLDPMQSMMKVKSVNSPVPTNGFNTDGELRHNFNQTSSTGAVVVSSAQWTPPISGGFIPPVINPAIPGTHVLSVQYGSRTQSRLADVLNIGGVPSPNGPIATVDNLALAIGDLALIANCDNVDLFTVSDTSLLDNGQLLEHAAPFNTDGQLDALYGLPQNIALTRVMRFISHIYYIADTGLENENGDQIRALYQQSYPYNDATNPPTEVIQGVENMRLSFGIQDNNTLRYVTADSPLFDPARVVSVQVGIIMTSWDSIAEQDDMNTYVIAGQSIPPSENSIDGNTHAADRRYRLVYNTTIKVRNRRDNDIVMTQQIN